MTEGLEHVHNEAPAAASGLVLQAGAVRDINLYDARRPFRTSELVMVALAALVLGGLAARAVKR